MDDKFSMDYKQQEKLKDLDKLCDDVETLANKKVQQITKDEAFTKVMECIKV